MDIKSDSLVSILVYHIEILTQSTAIIIMDNVTLHIYDLLPESQQSQATSTQEQSTTTTSSSFFSRLLSPLGFGAYHTSIDVRGFRYQFGAVTGIVRTSGSIEADRNIPPNAAYKESIILGQTWLELKDINAVITRMRDANWKGENYHLANRNCNHFSETFATAIILGDNLLEDNPNKSGQSLTTFPSWVNRLARTGTSFLGAQSDACIDIVAEARDAAGLKGKVGWNLSSSSSKNKSASTDKNRSQKKELTAKQKAMLEKLKKKSKT